MALTDKQLDRILDRLRRGNVMEHRANGGRLYIRLSHANGVFTWDEEDEGSHTNKAFDAEKTKEALATLQEDLVQHWLDVTR